MRHSVKPDDGWRLIEDDEELEFGDRVWLYDPGMWHTMLPGCVWPRSGNIFLRNVEDEPTSPPMNPCPFCGGDDIRVAVITNMGLSRTVQAKCGNCAAYGPVAFGWAADVDWANAVRMWNDRIAKKETQ